MPLQRRRPAELAPDEPPRPTGAGVVSLADAARILGRPERDVARLARCGHLETVPAGPDRVVVTVRSVHAERSWQRDATPTAKLARRARDLARR